MGPVAVNPTDMDPAEHIMEKALAIGFDLVGIVSAGPARHGEAFLRWLERGYAGGMTWMAIEPERRLTAGRGWVVVVGLRYMAGEPPPELWNDPLRGRVARYAWGRDYHDVMEPMLEELAKAIGAGSHHVCVDTGAVLERDLAGRAGIGFAGKSTNLIHKTMGSYLTLGELLVDFRFPIADCRFEGEEADSSQIEHSPCARCSRCLDACPTRAFVEPYVLDARRCISYLTIEHEGAIPEALRPRMGNWVFGCDVCQEVCPWNRRRDVSNGAAATRSSRLHFDPDTCAPRLTDLLEMDERGLLGRYAGTPVERAGLSRLRRNAVIALGNSGDPSVLPPLERVAREGDVVVREHAQWAIRRLRVPSSRFQVPSSGADNLELGT